MLYAKLRHHTSMQMSKHTVCNADMHSMLHMYYLHNTSLVWNVYPLNMGLFIEKAAANRNKWKQNIQSKVMCNIPKSRAEKT